MSNFNNSKCPVCGEIYDLQDLFDGEENPQADGCIEVECECGKDLYFSYSTMWHFGELEIDKEKEETKNA